MDETTFRQCLKRAGKQPHVIDGLVGQVRAFEAYLASRGHDLDDVTEQDVRDYVQSVPEREARIRLRGIALYLRSAGNLALARLASDLRGASIASNRQSVRLREFRGVDVQDVVQLKAAGIVTAEHMLAAGKTPLLRQQLAERTAVSPGVILELVKLSDLSRIFGVKATRARLYYDAGLDTPAKFAPWEPDALRRMLLDFVQRTGFDGIAPLPKEIAFTIAAARELPPAVEY